MAKRRRSRSEENKKVSDQRIFPSCPSFPPEYHIYVFFGEGRTVTQSFCSVKAAKRYFEHFTAEKSFKWLKPLVHSGGRERVLTEDGYEIQAYELEEIVEAESDGFEFDDEFYRRSIYRYLPEAIAAQEEAAKLKPVNVEAGERPVRAKKEKVKKPDGLISVGQIAEELKCEPFDARQVLRKNRIEKPAYGWSWPADEAKKIKALIKKGLK